MIPGKTWKSKYAGLPKRPVAYLMAVTKKDVQDDPSLARIVAIVVLECGHRVGLHEGVELLRRYPCKSCHEEAARHAIRQTFKDVKH